MPRAKAGAARHRRKVRILKAAKGYRGARSKQYRKAKEAVMRAGAAAYKHRRTRKRDFRTLWIIRLNAACRARGIPYSRFICGLKAAAVTLNRKVLSEIAISDPQAFDLVAEIAKAESSRQAA